MTDSKTSTFSQGKRTLLLLRHAQTQTPAASDDYERLLTDEGLLQAERAGQWINQRGLQPDFALVSTALRTRATFTRLSRQLEQEPAHRYDPVLYGASPEEWLAAIAQVASQHKVLLLIGHNPSIHELAVQLSGSGAQTTLAKLKSAYPPATLSQISLEGLSWNALTPETKGSLQTVVSF